MNIPSPGAPTLSAQDIAFFADNGFVRIDNAFPKEVAATARAILWQSLGLDPDNSRQWTRPVVRLGHFSQEPFVRAANTPRLHSAFDQLVGQDRWLPPGAVGTFPVRFPSPEDPGDTGWHVDVSFGADAPDFMEWRVNACSRGRALLMLLLFSDVGPEDAPTRIRAGSQRTIAQRLAGAGQDGLSLRELAATGFAESASLPEVVATGAPGTVYLCHPFLVHAAQPHRGLNPRFMAQPPLLPRGENGIDLTEPLSPLARAIL
jgi:hypothetical protein